MKVGVFVPFELPISTPVPLATVTVPLLVKAPGMMELLGLPLLKLIAPLLTMVAP